MSTTVFERARIVDPRGMGVSTVIVGRKIIAGGKTALNQGAPEGATIGAPARRSFPA